MTEITAPKSAVTAEQFADEIREQLKYTQGVTVEQAKPADVYVAASAAVRRHLVDSWMKTQADMVNGNTKAVGYLSAEFLIGKQLRNALLEGEAPGHEWVLSAGVMLVGSQPGLSFVRELVGL
mgnify:CR=1 FL=1